MCRNHLVWPLNIILLLILLLILPLPLFPHPLELLFIMLPSEDSSHYKLQQGDGERQHLATGPTGCYPWPDKLCPPFSSHYTQHFAIKQNIGYSVSQFVCRTLKGEGVEFELSDHSTSNIQRTVSKLTYGLIFSPPVPFLIVSHI